MPLSYFTMVDKELNVMRKPNAICKVCGKPYYACGSCEKTQSYKAMTDTIEHYNIYITCVMFSRKQLSATEAYDAISKYDLSDIPSDSPVMITVRQILDAGKVVKNESKVEVEPKKDITEKKTTNSYKKNVAKKNKKSENEATDTEM